MLTGNHLGNNAVHTALLSQLHIFCHIPHKGKNFALQAQRRDLADSLGILFQYGWRTCFNPVHSHRIQFFCDSYLLILCQNDARLLFPIPKRGVQKLNFGGEVEFLRYLRIVVCRTHPPFSFLMIAHLHASYVSYLENY